jgi:hypothetical protein
MQSKDQALGRTDQIAFLVAAIPGTRVVTANGLTQVSVAIGLARQNGLTWVAFGDESTANCQTLLANEESAASQIHGAHLSMLYVPMGVGALLSCYPTTPQLVTLADRVVFQAQNWQDSDPTIFSDIHRVVSDLRAIAPTHQVWIQLAADPPANPTITAAELISQIRSVQDGSSGQADGITIWYSSTTITTMEQTVLAFRP